MNYLLEPRWDNCFGIRNKDSDCLIGHVHRRSEKWHIEIDNIEDSEEVAVVGSIEEALPTFAAYYDKHPTQWEAETELRYTKLTQFGLLCVEQDEKGQWLANRCDYPLMRHDKPATFNTSKEAQRAADARISFGYPKSKKIEDGFSWVTDPGMAHFFAEQKRLSRIAFEHMAARHRAG